MTALIIISNQKENQFPQKEEFQIVQTDSYNEKTFCFIINTMTHHDVPQNLCWFIKTSGLWENIISHIKKMSWFRETARYNKMHGNSPRFLKKRETIKEDSAGDSKLEQ